MKLETLVGNWCPFLKNGDLFYVLDTNWNSRPSFKFALKDTRPYREATGDLLRVLNKPYGSVDFFPTELLVYRHQIGECLTKYQDVSAFVYKTTTTEILISDGRKVPIEDTLACLDFQTFVYGLSRMAPNEELFETYRALAKASPLRDLETSDLLYSDYMKHVVAEEYCAVHGFKKEGE